MIEPCIRALFNETKKEIQALQMHNAKKKMKDDEEEEEEEEDDDDDEWMDGWKKNKKKKKMGRLILLCIRCRGNLMDG